jgi:ribonuclease P protein component
VVARSETTYNPGMMTRRLIFGKTQRLHTRRDFDRVFPERCSVADRYLVVYVAANGLDRPRLGIPVGRKYGNAVRRNRVKRLIREAFRLEQHELPAGFDLVCIPRVGAQADLETYRRSVRRLAGMAARRWRKRGAQEAKEAAADGQEPGAD